MFEDNLIIQNIKITFSFFFLVPPKFVPLLHSEFIASEGGDTDTISCKVESRPGVTITWHIKGKQILTNNTLKYTITNSNEAKGNVVETVSTFKLLNAVKADFGIYTCNAANDFDTVETITTIKVYCKFIFICIPFF